MKISLTAGFQTELAALPDDGRVRVFNVILALPEAFRNPQRHTGTGLRKLHASGIWEARVGLGLRLVMALGTDEVVLVKIGTHDEVRRYLRSL